MSKIDHREIYFPKSGFSTGSLCIKIMYDTYFKEFDNEINSAIGCYLLWKCLHDRPSKDRKVLDSLNKTPLSWITIRHSLQVTYFIILGRIFDERKDSFKIMTLIDYCFNNIHLFSKQNLQKRKIKNFGDEPPWLDNYIDEAYEPIKEDFLKIGKEVEKHKKLFNEIYKPIRHKLIAHKSKSHIDNSDELYEKTKIEDIENILAFLNSVKMALFDIYMNGRRPDLTIYEINREFYEKDFNSLIDIVLNA